MKTLLTGWMLIASFIAFSQSGIDFSMSFTTNPSFTAGLDEVSREGTIFQVAVSIDQEQLRSLGNMSFQIYDLLSSSPLTILTVERTELLSGAYSNNGLLVFSFPYLDPKGSYKVILDIQNEKQAYLPRIEKTFQPTN